MASTNRFRPRLLSSDDPCSAAPSLLTSFIYLLLGIFGLCAFIRSYGMFFWALIVVFDAFGPSLTSASGPNATYPYANSNQTSPPRYPSPWSSGVADWSESYQQARTFVGQLTLLEKVNLTTGVGWQQERCVGQTGAIPRLGFRSLCMQDSPMGVRLSKCVVRCLRHVLIVFSRLQLGLPWWHHDRRDVRPWSDVPAWLCHGIGAPG